MEASALTGSNVDEVFTKCARTILTRIEAGTFQSFPLVLCFSGIY
jgi:hypothetical protein